MATFATAGFTLDTWNEEPYDESDGAVLSSVRISKTFTGEIDGHSEVRMLTAVNGESAAYGAFERLAVSVGGRAGTFVLQHTAGTEEGAVLRILPGSGTGELTGIIGGAEIARHEDGGHTLTLRYELDPGVR